MFFRRISSDEKRRSVVGSLLRKFGVACGFCLWIGVLFVLYKNGSTLETLSAEGKEGTTAVPVMALSVESAPSFREVRFFGVTRSLKQAVIAPLVSGRLKSRSVEVGDAVRSKEEIARIDSSEYSHLVAMKKAALSEGMAALRQGEADLERTNGLYREKVVSTQNMERQNTSVRRLRANCEVLKSQLKEAERKLKETHIRAPFDGVVTRVCSEPGEYLTPGTPVVELANRDVELQISVPETMLGSVKKGVTLKINFPMLGEKEISGKVLSVGDALGDDQKGVLFPVKIGLSQVEWLRSGMTAEAIFELPVKGRFLVPVAAVCNGDGESNSVFVVRDGVAVRVPLRPEEAIGDSVTVEGDMKEGELVVIGGHAFLSDGDIVAVRLWNGS